MSINCNQIEPIKKEKVSDIVFRQLLQMIRSGQWEAGYKLPSENKLCSLFNVSRVSVRTALHKLEAIGLIDVRNGEGTFVRSTNIQSALETVFETLPLTPNDVIDILVFRKVIEESCVREMAKHHTDEEIAELEHCLNQMQHFSQTKDVVKFSTWDAKFHRTIVNCSRNQVMITVYDLIFESMYAHLYTMNKLLGFELGLPYHKRMFQAILQGDADKAGESVVQSIDDSIAKMHQAYEKQTDSIL